MARKATKALALLVGTTAGLVLCEAGLRVGWHNPYRDETPDALLKIAIQHPDTDHLLDRSPIEPGSAAVRFRTDERGYILPAPRRLDADARIVFLGGSTTECKFVQEDLRFPALVGGLLAARGLRVDTLNGGRSGNTVHDEVNVLLNHAVADRPDVAVLMEATNDHGVLSLAGDYASRSGAPVTLRDMARWSLQMGSSWSYLAGLLRQWITAAPLVEPTTAQPAARSSELSEALSKETSLEYARRLRAFVAVSRAFDIEPILMTQPFSGSSTDLTPAWTDLKGQDRFNAIVREVARVEHVTLIDLVAYLDADVPDWRRPGVVFYDGLHVNDRGSRIYAERIARDLEPVLAGLR